MKKLVNFVGCGRLGQSIARLFVMHDVVSIAGIVNSSMQSATKAVEFVGEGNAYPEISQLPQADIYFITSGDNLIRPLCEELIATNAVKSAAIIVHCSGFLPSSILRVNKNQALVASVHPIKSFANPEIAVKNFKNVYCSFEGDPRVRDALQKIFEKIGGHFFEIAEKDKQKYHAALVMANNYLTTLHYQSMKMLEQSGVDEKIAKNIVSMLMGDALTNVKQMNHQKALTGPIQRGEVDVVKGHMDALKNDPVFLAIYSALGQGTLGMMGPR